MIIAWSIYRWVHYSLTKFANQDMTQEILIQARYVEQKHKTATQKVGIPTRQLIQIWQFLLTQA